MNMLCHSNDRVAGDQPLVSIIIVTFNNASVIKNCLLALREQSYRNAEVIVVDNDSADSTVRIIENFPDVKLVEAGINLGFTGGNILGLSHIQGELIVLLNPDTEPSPVWLEQLVHGMETDQQLGLCASKLIVYGTDIIDSAGDGSTTTGRGFKRGEGKDSSLYNTLEYVFGACGGAVMLRRELIADIGFLDNDFFLIHEDTDLNFRAQLAGWKCLFVPKAVVYHKVRSSIGIMSDMAVYYSVRNSRFVWVKNMPIKLILKYLHHHIIQEIGSFLYFCIKHRKWRAYWHANIDFIKLLPGMIKKRKQVMRLKKITDSELEEKLFAITDKQLFREKLSKILNE